MTDPCTCDYNIQPVCSAADVHFVVKVTLPPLNPFPETGHINSHQLSPIQITLSNKTFTGNLGVRPNIKKKGG